MRRGIWNVSVLLCLVLLVPMVSSGQSPSINYYPSGSFSFTVGPTSENIHYYPAIQGYNWYVNSETGDDANDGTSASKALQTLGTGLNGKAVVAGDRVLLTGLFRESWVVPSGWSGSAGNPIEFIAAESGAEIRGSTAATSGWTVVSGTEYNQTYASAPVNVFVLSGSTVTKLIRDDVGVGSLASGKWGWSLGTTKVHVNTGADPNAQTLELPFATANNVAILNGQDYITFTGISSRFAANNGLEVGGTSDHLEWSGGHLSYNGNDGAGIRSAATNVAFSEVTVTQNGQAFPSATGAGDGISFHDTTTGSITLCTFSLNTKAAVTNGTRTQTTVTHNTISGDVRAVLIFADGNGGTALVHHNAATVSANSSAAGFDFATGITVQAYFNTIYQAGNQGPCITTNATLATLNNNICRGFFNGIRQISGSSLAMDYNAVSGSSSASYRDCVAGAHDVAGDPLLQVDLTLGEGSPAIDAGIDIPGVTGSYLGLAPDIGAYEKE